MIDDTRNVTEFVLEQQTSLSAKAAERVTWEAAAKIVAEQASAHFLHGRDEIAQILRGLARQMNERAQKASEEQSQLLHEMYPKGVR